MKYFNNVFISVLCLILVGCGSTPVLYDYTEFRKSDPSSILVLPPINNTTEVVATYGVMSRVIAPISEAGYYPLPVALVEQTFRNNGLTVPEDIHALPKEKLQEIFGADTALYLNIQEYGTSYVIISSDTVVTISAQLIDLSTGNLLWEKTATASSAETRSNSNSGGLIGMLVVAAMNQIIETVSDQGFKIAGITASRLLSKNSVNGLLPGPRSREYKQPIVEGQ
ncbi:DUF799 domain-containing protein [Glaciecola sp. HTCC2999]|jgi:hypothetical protein|uniref:DUF799 domain-containing protein n=1 Tax=Glaciecola sp. HTCC2999 TaxID=455436 RepID=UPI0000E0F4A9|nr:DUF799 domain-containing protein [Glaciecola sp. HTCC2999]